MSDDTQPRQIIPTDQLPAQPLQLDDERQAKLDEMKAMHEALRQLQAAPPTTNGETS